MTVAVIFASRRTADYDDEYAVLAARMDELAREQPGFVDIMGVRDPVTREGVTVSFFVDEAAARAWKQHPEHLEAQRLGRERFYEEYRVWVADVTRSYAGGH